MINRLSHYWLKPKLCLSIFACHMNMYSFLLLYEDPTNNRVKPKVLRCHGHRIIARPAKLESKDMNLSTYIYRACAGRQWLYFFYPALFFLHQSLSERGNRLSFSYRVQAFVRLCFYSKLVFFKTEDGA